MNKLYDIFSVPIYEFELEVNNEELKTFIEIFKKLPGRSATKSNVGGFQSIDLPLDTTEVMHLVNVIERTINDDSAFDSFDDEYPSLYHPSPLRIKFICPGMSL